MDKKRHKTRKRKSISDWRRRIPEWDGSMPDWKRYRPAAVLLLVLIIYLAGARHYAGHFRPDARINGVRVGGMTVKEAENLFEQDFTAHKITIIEKKRKETIRAEEIGTVIDVGDQVAKAAKKENPWGWIFHLLGKHNYDVDISVSYDESRLARAVDSLACFDRSKVISPQSARVVPGEDKFRILPEVEGNKVEKDAFLDSLKECITTGKTEMDLEKMGLYLLPEYYRKDKAVKAAVKKADKLAKSVIIYDFQYRKEKVDYDRIKDWIDISDDFKVSLNDDKVGSFVLELAREYNTMGSKRSFLTEAGKTITIYDGNYGWKIYSEKEKEKLIKDIEAGKTVEREPVYSYKGNCRNSKDDDIGQSYVEVSIKKQTLWLFLDGKKALTCPVVTGKPKAESATEKGVYAINYKQKDATLTGPDAAGGSYSSEVDFWMPFNGNQGLHNAPWRDRFGGTIYKTNGSHGCVNMPYDGAKTVYEAVREGFPVVIY